MVHKPLFNYPVLALEQQILEILWRQENVTIRELLAHSELRGRPYTSVHTAVLRLIKKGLVTRACDNGIVSYSAACSREQIQRAMAHDAFEQLLDLNPDRLTAISHLVEVVADLPMLEELERLVKEKCVEMRKHKTTKALD